MLLKMDNFDTAYNVTSDNSQELDLGSAVLSVGGLAPGVDSLHVKSAAMIGNLAMIGNPARLTFQLFFGCFSVVFPSFFGCFSVAIRLLFGCFSVAFWWLFCHLCQLDQEGGPIGLQ